MLYYFYFVIIIYYYYTIRIMTKVTYKENRKIGISVYYIHRKEHFTTNAAYEKVNILSEFCKLSCTEGIMMEVLGPEQEVLLDFSSFTKFFEKLVNFLSHHYACVGMQESAKQLVVLFIYIFYFNNTNN
jgi:hypothetical protein